MSSHRYRVVSWRRSYRDEEPRGLHPTSARFPTLMKQPSR